VKQRRTEIFQRQRGGADNEERDYSDRGTPANEAVAEMATASLSPSPDDLDVPCFGIAHTYSYLRRPSWAPDWRHFAANIAAV